MVTFAGSHAELAVGTEVGTIFLVTSEITELPAANSPVQLAIAPSAAVMLLD